MKNLRDIIKKRLLQEYGKTSMPRSVMNGNRKPNPNFRDRNRRVVPFDKWGEEFPKWLSEQEAKQLKKAKK
jgi:hypothetical protein